LLQHRAINKVNRPKAERGRGTPYAASNRSRQFAPLTADIVEHRSAPVPLAKSRAPFKRYWQNQLTTVVEDDDAGADVFCAPMEEPAAFDIFDNDREAKSIVQRISNPTMLLRDITEVNSAMVIRHGVIAA
jgi:hypothetical protein